MKKLILLLVILIFQLQLYAQQQEKITASFKLYKVKMLLRSEEKVDAILYSVTDSTITVSNSVRIKDYRLGTYTTKEYRLDEIQWVKAYRRKGGWGSGMVGLIVGGGVGLAIGKHRNEKLAYEKLAYGKFLVKNRKTKGLVIGSVLGGTIGAMIGRHGVSRLSNHRDRLLRRLKRRAIKKY